MASTPPDGPEFDGTAAPPPLVRPVAEPFPEIPSVRPVPPPPGFGQALLWCLGYLGFQIVVGAAAVIAVFLLIRFGPGGGEIDQQSLTVRAMAWGTVIEKVLEVFFILLVIRWVVGRDWTRRLAVTRPSFQHLLLAIIAIPAFVLVGNALGELLERVSSEVSGGLRDLEEMIGKMFEVMPLWAAVLAIGVCPGVGEELWCRGFLGRGLVARYGVWVGVAAASFLFGALHVLPGQAAVAMCLGVLLHFTYLMTRSLWVPILIHFANNSLAVLLTRDSVRLPRFQTEEPLPAVVYAAAILLVLAVGVAFYRGRARLVPIDPDRPAWRPPYPSVELPPPGSDTVVVRPFAGLRAWALVLAAAGVFGLALVFA
ncbi:MAG TPA: CPBP family intramembrane glutamic endopeptidase [Gemmataceae bacterium]